MADFTQMDYNPSDGLMDKMAYETVPGSEDAARAQFQDMFDQVKAYINETLLSELQSISGNSGADRIGSAEIGNLYNQEGYPTTVRGQIALLKTKLDDALENQITISDYIGPGDIAGDYLADSAVSEGKLADNAVTTDKIYAGAVTNDKLGLYAVTSSKINSEAVVESKISNAAVSETKIAAGAVTETKLAASAVTRDKISNGEVVADKIGAGAVTGIKLASGSVTGTKIADSTISESKLDATLAAKMVAERTRMITVSTADPSGGTSGDLWIKLI